MKTKLLSTAVLVSIIILSGCKLGKSKSGSIKNDGQLHGVAPSSKYNLPKPPGMIYVPSGTFHMGPSDEDINYAFTARNKQVSISAFWMDATEITNNEYRQFTSWVRDSIAAKLLGYVKQGADILTGQRPVKLNGMTRLLLKK
jgi:sulfatase modifying factor 1